MKRVITVLLLMIVFASCNNQNKKAEAIADTTTINQIEDADTTNKKIDEADTTPIFYNVKDVIKSNNPIIEYKGKVLLKVDSLQTSEIVEYDLNNDGKKEILVAYTLDPISAHLVVFSSDFKKIAEIENSTNIKLINGNIVFERYHEDNTEQNIYALKGNELVFIEEKAIDIK